MSQMMPFPCGSEGPCGPLRHAIQSLSSEVKHCLRRQPYLELRRVTCELRDDVLILRGRVSCYHLKQLAQTAVSRIEGIKRIENQIDVIRPDTAS